MNPRVPEVAKAEVQGKLVIHLPVVLDVRLEIGHLPVALGIAAHGSTVERLSAFLILLDPTQEHVRQSVSRTDGSSAEETQKTLSVKAELLALPVVLKVEPELHRVVAVRPGNVVLPGDDGIRVKPGMVRCILCHAIGCVPTECDGGQ